MTRRLALSGIAILSLRILKDGPSIAGMVFGRQYESAVLTLSSAVLILLIPLYTVRATAPCARILIHYEPVLVVAFVPHGMCDCVHSKCYLKRTPLFLDAKSIPYRY